MTAVPPQAVLERQLRDIEAEVGRRGWDGRPVLYMLHDTGTGPTCTVAVDEWPSGQHGDLIEYLADSMAGGLMAKMLVARQRRATPGVYGAAFVSEVWVNEDRDLARRRVRGETTRKLADVPGSVEARVVCAYVATGHSYMLIHRRGRDYDPLWVTEPDGSGPMSAVGRIPESLARITIALIGGSMPASLADGGLPEWLRARAAGEDL